MLVHLFSSFNKIESNSASSTVLRVLPDFWLLSAKQFWFESWESLRLLIVTFSLYKRHLHFHFLLWGGSGRFIHQDWWIIRAIQSIFIHPITVNQSVSAFKNMYFESSISLYIDCGRKKIDWTCIMLSNSWEIPVSFSFLKFKYIQFKF